LAGIRSKHPLIERGSSAPDRANSVGRRFAYRACARASWERIRRGGDVGTAPLERDADRRLDGGYEGLK
jgi:hypothetical protein